MGKNTGKLKGINGWLLIPVVNLFGLALCYFFEISSLSGLYRVGNLILFNVLFLAPSIIGIIFIFKRSKYAPVWAISAFWLDVVYSLTYPYLLIKHGFVPDNPIGNPLIFAIIWTVYLVKSKRVKNTFVE